MRLLNLSICQKKRTFSSYFHRYEDLYKMDCSNCSKKVRLMLRKLGTVKYTMSFHKRWKCMNLIKKDDFTTSASIGTDQCEGFKLAKLSPNNFKRLIFVQGLVSTKDTLIRRRISNKLENEPNLT